MLKLRSRAMCAADNGTAHWSRSSVDSCKASKQEQRVCFVGVFLFRQVLMSQHDLAARRGAHSILLSGHVVGFWVTIELSASGVQTKVAAWHVFTTL